MRPASFGLNPDPSLNVRVTVDVAAKHGLSAEEYDQVKRLLHRDPNYTELGVFSVLWSERCSYKNTRPLLKQFPSEKEGAPGKFGAVLLKAGEGKAGVIDLGGGWAAAFRIESHNHPSAVNPFEGASSGVGGVMRDVIAVGARPILLTNSLRFGELAVPETRALFREVVSGIAHHGREVGAPVVGGDLYFDKSYAGNPLVNLFCLGVLRHEDIVRGRTAKAGDVLFYIGAPTGREGIGAAAFASRPLGSAGETPKVQKSDAPAARRLVEACLEVLRVPGLVLGIQDLGAAGLARALAETASRMQAGAEANLDLVPKREEKLNSFELLLSESQERMLLVIRQGREAEAKAILLKHGLQASAIGALTGSSRLQVRQAGVLVADIPVAALTEKAPVYFREAMVPSYFANTSSWTPDVSSVRDLDHTGITKALPRLLAHPTLSSRRWVARQFEGAVRADVQVEAGCDAAVVRVKLGEQERILAISNDGNGRYCYLNPRRGALIAVAESLRNLTCSGAVPLALTDNLNFGDPYKPECFYQLKEAIRGLSEACRFFDLPVVGGNVSLYNESPTGAIDPTPVVTVVGLVEQEKHITRSSVGAAGEKLILLGSMGLEISASQYLSLMQGLKTGDAPQIDLGNEERLLATVRTLIRAGLVSAAHDVSEGGLLVALAEMLFAPGRSFGARLDLTSIVAGRNDAMLFGEGQGRVVLSVKQENLGRTISEAHMQGVCAAMIGEISEDETLALKTRSLTATWSVPALRKAWENSLDEAMKGA